MGLSVEIKLNSPPLKYKFTLPETAPYYMMQASFIEHQNIPHPAAELVINLAGLSSVDEEVVKSWDQDTFKTIKAGLVKAWKIGARHCPCELEMLSISDNESSRNEGEPYVIWLKWGATNEPLATLSFFSLTAFETNASA